MVNAAAYQSAFSPNVTNANRSVTIPNTVTAGQLIVLVAEVLVETVTHSITAGPAFVGPAVESRAGISVAVWTRVATLADRGLTVTVTTTGTAVSQGRVALLVDPETVTPGTIVSIDQQSGFYTIPVPAFTPSATSRALQIVCIGASSDLNASLTPPANIDIVASKLPMDTGNRTGIAFGASDPGETVGNVWQNTSTHFAASFLVTLNLPTVTTPPPTVTAAAQAGDVVEVTVAAGSTVVLSGVTPLPTLTGTGTVRSFTAPIRGSDVTVTVSSTLSGTTKTGSVAVKACADQVVAGGAWVPSYRIVGPDTGATVVPLNLT